MVYNRCVGTRYCSNNCPYKVRRFNFLLYSDWNTPELVAAAQPRRHGPQPRRHGEVHVLRAAHQPRAHRRRRREERAIRDGEIVTACQAACPAEAIVFGDLNDPNSRVTKLQGAAAQLRPARGSRTRGRGRRIWRRFATRIRSSKPGATGERTTEHTDGLDKRRRSTTRRRRRSSSRGTRFESITEKITSIVLDGRTRRSAGSSSTRHRRSCSSTCLMVSIGYLLAQGHRHLGQQRPGRLGVRHHQLRLVDRHRPRRHADLGDPAAAQAGLAHVDQPLRRSDDALRRRLRGDVPADPHRPSVAGGLLAVPVSEHDGHLAAVPQPADLGRVRGLDLRHGLAAVLVHRADPRPGDAARPGEEQAR